jgi:type IV pilus assembly protein PilO
MASKTRAFDVTTLFEQAATQFRGLNPQEPGQWPMLPKVSAWLLAMVVALGLVWVVILSTEYEELNLERDREPALKEDYRAKLGKAVNLEELKKQKRQVQEFVAQLEKQLPGKAEMDALLSDINQAGLGRGLQFELFRPGQVEVKEYYAELPITLKVSGRYHDIGAFAADVANLSRIVTLHNLVVGFQGKDAAAGGVLVMDATARTYRYLDASEVEQQRKAAAEAKKKAAANRSSS